MNVNARPAILGDMTPQAFIFIGRYAAGKGTQADLLIKKLAEKDPERAPLYVYTGQQFRNYIKGEKATAKLTRKVVESGGLMPEFMAIYMWARLLVEEYRGVEDLVFDGSPRRLLEAQVMDSVFAFYGMGKPYVIYLDVEHEESHRRLMLRAKTSGRPDDGPAEIENRKRVYEADIVPVIEYYRTSPNVNFIDIDGERSVEEIHAHVVQRLGLG